MSTAVAIHPTKHALDRFRQRVIPLLPEETRSQFNKLNRIKNLIKRASLINEGSTPARDGLIKIHAFINIDGLPPIPLTFVLNPENNVVVTLYKQNGWNVVYKSGKMEWRWSL